MKNKTSNGLKKSIQVGLSALGIMSVSANTLAAAGLTVGDNTQVTMIDNQPMSVSIFSDGPKAFSLPAGKHTITAKYKRLFELTADDHDVLRSVELTVTGNLQDGKNYQVLMANQPDNYYDAQAYAEKPTLQLVESSGSEVLHSTTAITPSSSGLFGGVVGRLFGSGGGQPVTVNTTAKAVEQPQPKNAQQANTALDQFMRIWLNATPAEREKIKNWVKDQ